MTYDQLETHFGGVKQVMAAFNVASRQTIHNWKHQGIPEGIQFKAEVLTAGALKADPPKAASSDEARAA